MAHFLILAFPSQGHINPSLHFAKRLLRTGATVTFATSIFANRRMIKSPPLDGLTYATFDDGSDHGVKVMEDVGKYLVQLVDFGTRSVSDLIRRLADEGRPVTCLVYGMLLEWAADVALTAGIPSALLYSQPATVLAIYYHRFHGYEDLIRSKEKNPLSSVELPGLPLLQAKELPSFIQRPNEYPSVLPTFKKLVEILDKEPKQKVLVNTFDSLEEYAIHAFDKMEVVGVGPLIPSAFLDRSETTEIDSGGDLFKKSKDYVEWLDSKPASSVVYVSFGSITVLPEHQMAEILNGLLESDRPFLWVVRRPEEGKDTDPDTEFWKRARAAEESKQGLIVPWCSQVAVLSHPSVGCFVSHCGWNSTSESLTMGVPVVGFPQWADQPTNAKLVESVWKTGVRVKVNGDGVLEGSELKRCLNLVFDGYHGECIRKNALKWRDLAREASAPGGSSDRNIRAFVAEMLRLAQSTLADCSILQHLDCER